jgi:hypothetical protein
MFRSLLSATADMNPPMKHGYDAFGVGPEQFFQRSLSRLMKPTRNDNGRKLIHQRAAYVPLTLLTDAR